MVCDPLGDYNVWASTRPINNTAKGHKMWESVVIAAARVSYRREFIFFLSVTKSVLKGPCQHFFYYSAAFVIYWHTRASS